MEIKQFLIMIRKKVIFIVLIPILVSFIAALVSVYFVTPIYQASSTVYITPQKSVLEGEVTYQEIITNQQLVKDYRELIKSKLITKAVLEELEIHDVTPSDLSNRITVSSKNDTRILEIKVEDTNPVRCMELSNTLCEVFLEKSLDLAKANNVSILDTAEVPLTPIKPNVTLYTLLAFLTSLFATIGIFYLLEIISETIKTSEDIETYLDLNVLGTIPSFNIK